MLYKYTQNTVQIARHNVLDGSLYIDVSNLTKRHSVEYMQSKSKGT